MSDTKNITNMDALYRHIEENATNYKYPHNIGDEFKALRDRYHKENQEEEARKAQWEIDVFFFMLEEGDVKPMMTWTGQNGDVVEVPSMKDYNEKTFLYLIDRLNSTANPLLRSRYAHILWNSPKKHAKYAREAVESYLELADIYEKKDLENPSDNFGLDVLRAVRNAFFIARRSKHKINEAKIRIIKLIKKFNLESSSSYALRFDLVNLMLSEKRAFKEEDFRGIQRVLWQLSGALFIERNFQPAIQICELGEKVDQRIGVNTNNWMKRIAESYEALLEQSEGQRGVAHLFFCEKAIENYKRINNAKKVEKLTKKFDDIKGSVKFAEFSQEIDLSDYIKKCRKIGEDIASKEFEQIIRTLMHDKGLLPRHKEVGKQAEDLSKKTVIKNLIPEVIIDQSGHPAQHFTEEDEKKYLGILQQFQMYLQVTKIPLIREIFISAIRNNKLNTESFLDYLKKNSWYGKNLNKKVADSEIAYNWLSQIAPAIDDYFTKMRFFLASSTLPNMVLSIDSLTLKIEGLIRDICRFSGVSTIFLKKDKKGREMVQEKDLHALLYDDKIKELFDEDDFLFFRFLLVEKVGYNLRHKIAHALMDYREYGIDVMHLLILALLRIGKYDFEKKVKQTKKV